MANKRSRRLHKFPSEESVFVCRFLFSAANTDVVYANVSTADNLTSNSVTEILLTV